MKKKIIAVIPAYNEAQRIEPVIQETKRYVDEVIVVDDGSQDDTAQIAAKAGAHVLQHLINLGKGAGLKTGCECAVLHHADIIIMLDADGQHEPVDIKRFIEKVKEGYDIVFGVRELQKGSPFILRLGNEIISTMIFLLFHIHIKDSQCGFRAFTAKAYESIKWRSTDYALESEMIVNAKQHKLSCTQLKIKNIYNDRFKGTGVIDGMKIVANLLWWRIRGV
ncbi:glycosyltransferase family 2 protein [Candidatus Woesearchaeota archaeon]|nr:MAG: family 2 glycosyl transferase [archaeon GW2011_AR4]MBS3129416.1 glycosyltransferase family 2 protein [Candidatus Woesearchaeota archaeon]HIH38457.1 glycosyltransferase family 2 protein [Candidatus Woesearchaeota archaeon]HIH49803.1 glycosyltransferase family 2 protein [Candidatus Woesearchaeota archaeon]HIJ03470.1 glycosyltransferase family 2 protein [Candidatus Woesearchaeota archaeon]